MQNTSVAQETNPYGTSVFQTECEKYALADPVRRAVGKGVSFNESTARNLAELDARAAMSRAIDAAVEDAAKSSSFGYQQHSGNDTSGQSAYDEGGKTNTTSASYSANIIKNTSIVKTDKFLGSNKQYTVFVCLEYNGSSAEMVRNITQNVLQRIPDNARKNINDEINAFENTVESKLKNLKK